MGLHHPRKKQRNHEFLGRLFPVSQSPLYDFTTALSHLHWNLHVRLHRSNIHEWILANSTSVPSEWGNPKKFLGLCLCLHLDLILITLDRHECFSIFHHLQKDKQRKPRQSLKLGKKRLESSKGNYYTISSRVIIKALIIINWGCLFKHLKKVN